MPGWTHPAMDRIPLLPEDVRRNGLSREQVNLGIGAMGVLMAAALVEGYRIRKVTLTRCQGHFIMRSCSRVLSIPRRVSVEPVSLVLFVCAGRPSGPCNISVSRSSFPLLRAWRVS